MDAYEQTLHDRLYTQALQFAKARMPATVAQYEPADWVVSAVLDALKSVEAPTKPATPYSAPSAMERSLAKGTIVKHRCLQGASDGNLDIPEWMIDAFVEALRFEAQKAPAKPATKQYEFRTLQWYHESLINEDFDSCLARLCVGGWRLAARYEGQITLEREVS